MGITITPAPPATAAPALKSLGATTVMADGTEQILVEQPGGSPSLVSGYVDMSQLVGGDSVKIRLYTRIKAGGSWVKYAEPTVTDSQPLPLLYVAAKPENHGLKVTLQQTAGTYRSFDYEFFEEV